MGAVFSPPVKLHPATSATAVARQPRTGTTVRMDCLPDVCHSAAPAMIAPTIAIGLLT
jgi:hypothetical protein